MKIQGTRDDFLNCLQKVSASAQSGGGVFPILANVLLEADADSAVVTATDQETQTKSVSPVKANKKFNATVSAKMFQSILQRLQPGCEVNFDYQEGKGKSEQPFIHISAGKTRYKLNTIAAGEFPRLGAKAKMKPLFDLPADKLLHGLNKVAYASAVNSHRMNLNGVMLEASMDGLRLVATDGHRMAIQTVDAKKFEGEARQFILPKKSVSELARNLPAEGDKEMKLESSDQVIRFHGTDFELTSNIITEAFPDYRSVIPRNNDKKIKLDRESLLAGLRRVSAVASNKGETVVLTFDKNTASLECTNQDGEVATDEIAADYKGEKIEIGFNVDFLTDMLSASEDAEQQISVLDISSSVLIEPAGQKTPNFQYVVMPIRLR